MLSRGEVVAAADLLESMGARSIEANVRRRAAELLQLPDPAESLRQLDRAAAFWRGVGAKASLRQVDELSLALRPAAS